MSYIVIEPPDEFVQIDLNATPEDGQTLVYDAANHKWKAGGWTTIELASDFATSSTSPSDVTGWSFTPEANKTYEFEVKALVSASATTTGVRLGFVFPSGTTTGARTLTPSTIAADYVTNVVSTGGTSAALQSVSGNSFMDSAGLCVAYASPSGSVTVRLQSEVAASFVFIKKGSIFRYREV